MTLDRRRFLRVGALGGLAAVAAACSRGGPDLVVPPGPTPSTEVRPSGPALWPGHRPGSIYVGVAAGGDLRSTLDATGPVGAHRTFYQWGELDREVRRIGRDHAEGRLPWVSFKPPADSPDGWVDIAAGRFDADLARRAEAYAGLEHPVVVTFHHEPHNDPGEGEQFAAAWVHVHDVLRAEADLAHVAMVPVMGEWVWNARNEEGQPSHYLTAELLDRSSFLGVDIYQNRSGDTYATRLGQVLAWLDSRGHSRLMIGIGETASTDDFGSPTAAEWWTESWTWAERNTDRLGVVSYFNSTRNNRSGNDWLLTQSPQKLEAFRATVASPKACRLFD